MRLLKIPRNGKINSALIIKCDLMKQVIESTKDMYRTTGFLEPWVGYLAFMGQQCIGTCAFKSAPEAGKVEIAYYTFPEFEGRGIASKMAKALVEIAHGENPNLIVTAQTAAEENAATSVLKKIGFEFAAEAGDFWEWHFKPQMKFFN